MAEPRTGFEQPEPRSAPRRGGRWIRVAFSGLGLAVLLGGGAYGYWNVVEHRFLAVAEGRLYQSAEMPLDTLASRIEEHGIRTVVDLRKPSNKVEAEHAALTRLGVEHVRLPAKQIPSAETVTSFLDLMDDGEKLPVLVHCEHGQGRSMLFASIYRIEFEGWSQDRARRATRFLPFLGSFSQDRSKGQYLLNYVPRGPQEDSLSGSR